MDDNTKKTLITIGAVLVADLAFYYIASPYQNCLRGLGFSDGYAVRMCTERTSW